MPKHDQLYRYLFENHSVRGELVTVNDTYNEMLSNHDYPQPVKWLLGEMLVATSLLTATLKFDGEITVQLQGDGPLSLAVINGNNFQQMRGVARVKSDIADGSSLKEMIGNGYLVITITPTEGERYQGVVGLEGETLSECIENYFMQSEQLPTRLFIRTGQFEDRNMAAGILLQVMPASDRKEGSFEHLSVLTETIKPEELFSLPAEQVLYRLYHEEDVTLFEAQAVNFHCTCSRERCADTLMALPVSEVDTMLAEDGHIDMHCDFCGNNYYFDAVDIKSIRSGHGSAEADSSSIH
jgi:molecular chaperone Hsp33